MNMPRDELAQKCLEIERNGGSVLDYLRTEQGCYSPWGTWFVLQIEELKRKSWQVTDGRGKRVRAKQNEKRELKQMKLSNEQRTVLLECAISGGDPIAFLQEAGFKNQHAVWGGVRRHLREKDPETYLKIPEALRECRKVPGKLQEAQEGTCAVQDARTEAPEEKPAERPVLAQIDAKDDPEPICRPLTYLGYEVTTIRMPGFGEFHYDAKNGYFDWYSETADVISMTVLEWKQLMQALPEIMKVLGVKLS